MSADPPTTIVAVDDEEMVVKSLSFFLELETDYTVKIFTAASEALKFIAATEVDLVMSDYLMPEMDGLKFLSKVRDLKPEVPRIILTGYADKENAIKAINEVQLFQYVEKPWDSPALKNVIRAGLERQHLIRSIYTLVEQLARTEQDLSRLRKGLVRAFA
jgi:DNA-binding NtrC family response regulator